MGVKMVYQSARSERMNPKHLLHVAQSWPSAKNSRLRPKTFQTALTYLYSLLPYIVPELRHQHIEHCGRSGHCHIPQLACWLGLVGHRCRSCLLDDCGRKAMENALLLLAHSFVAVQSQSAVRQYTW